MINLILFGPPGSGKGTQAKNLAETFQFLHISTGDLFRYEIQNETPLGVEAQSYISRGVLVPDSITIGMLKNKVEAHPEAKGLILDGFPRTIPQAEALDEFLASKDQIITALIALDVDDEEIVKRILERSKTSGRADDANEQIIRNRIGVYNEETAPVFQYYESKSRSHTVNGIGDIEMINKRLTVLIEDLIDQSS